MIKKIILSVSNSGVDEDQTVLFTDKLIVRNHFALICAFFSSIYFFYFIANNHVIGAICISISIAFFITSIALNYLHHYNLSKAVLILVTNFSVLFTSILFGFKSGFHLYLLTSPLITFMLFESKQRLVFVLSILSYCLNFIVLLLLYKYYSIESALIDNDQSDTMYLLNFSFTIFITITLLLYYSYNNVKVNSLLNKTNEALVTQQSHLKKEIVTRKRTEEELVSLLSDKSMLLTEINHRVKNNLAVISGLLELETSYIKDENTSRVIKENNGRIKSIALLHEQLYQNKNIGHINLNEYVSQLNQNIVSSYNRQIKELPISVDVEGIELTMDLALPVALILNELIVNVITNTTIYKSHINLSIQRLNDKINVSFNAEFINEPNFEAGYKKTFAFHLIEALTSQLNGGNEYNFNNGLRFKITF